MRPSIGSIKNLVIAIFENKISLILILTILIGVVSTLPEFPEERVTHWNGHAGMFLEWDFYFSLQPFISIAFVLGYYFVNKKTWIDKVIIPVYIAWDFIGFLMYKYEGWPDDSNRQKLFLVGGFFVTVILFLSLIIYQIKRNGT